MASIGVGVTGIYCYNKQIFHRVLQHLHRPLTLDQPHAYEREQVNGSVWCLILPCMLPRQHIAMFLRMLGLYTHYIHGSLGFIQLCSNPAKVHSNNT